MQQKKLGKFVYFKILHSKQANQFTREGTDREKMRIILCIRSKRINPEYVEHFCKPKKDKGLDTKVGQSRQ